MIEPNAKQRRCQATGKLIFESRKRAHMAARNIGKRFLDTMTAYPCRGGCHGWHIGHTALHQQKRYNQRNPKRVYKYRKNHD